MAERKRSSSRKQEILLTLLDQADKMGPDRISAATIAKEIGISPPAIFKHFQSIEKLWISVAEYIEAVMIERWEKALNVEQSPSKQIRQLVLTQLRFIQTVPAVPSILFSRELHTSNKVLRQAFAGIMQVLHQRITSIVICGQKRGCFRRNSSPEDMALLIMNFIQGLAVRWSVSSKSFRLVKEGERLLEMQMQILYEQGKNHE